MYLPPPNEGFVLAGQVMGRPSHSCVHKAAGKKGGGQKFLLNLPLRPRTSVRGLVFPCHSFSGVGLQTPVPAKTPTGGPPLGQQSDRQIEDFSDVLVLQTGRGSQ